MKKFPIVATSVVLSLMAMSCGAPKQMATAPASNNPFGETFEAPCQEYDTEEYFTATGMANGPQTRMDGLNALALANAQNIVRQKMQHAYKGAIDDYSNAIGTNAGTDIQTKLERGGTQVIDQIINDTQENCVKYSAVDSRGNIRCYVGIRISKEEVATAIADYVSDDEELKVRFNEFDFRKRMEENFKKFKED